MPHPVRPRCPLSDGNALQTLRTLALAYGPVSARRFSEETGVSRDAVWNRLTSLRRRGLAESRVGVSRARQALLWEPTADAFDAALTRAA